MLHSKVANLVKVGTVLVTLLTSQTIGTGVSLLSSNGHDLDAKTAAASTLPVFVDRQDSTPFRTVVTANEVPPSSLHNVLSL